MKPEEEQGAVQFGDRRIPYRLHRGKRRSLRIAVSVDLTVDVFAPQAAGDDRITTVLQKKAGWIARTLDRLANYHPLPAPKRYVSGETLAYLGRQYRLKVENGSRRPARLSGKYLWVWAGSKGDARTVKRDIETWYRKRANDVLSRYLEKCQAIAARHGVPVPYMVIRSMQKRWGSCSASGRIALNTHLIQVPAHCIEYVIMHELCHLKHLNHSKAFYALLSRCMPDWRSRKELLGRLIAS